MLKIDKNHVRTLVFNIGYIINKKVNDYENIHSVNPLYLTISHASGYIEKKGVNKYLVFDSMDENKDYLKNTIMFFMEF